MNLDGESSNQQQLTWRLWGEEKSENIIYTVYLKKVRYYRPIKSISSDSDDEISHLEWETVRVKFVKAGTLEKLVDCLTCADNELESTYVNIFFATYRTFASAQKVLTLMLDRYERLINNELNLSEMVTEQLKKSVIIGIRIWLDSYPNDFRDPPLHAALHQLIFFVQHYLPDSELLLKAKHRLSRLINDNLIDDNYSLYTNENVICLNTNGHYGISYNFPDIPSKHFAEQLTRIDMELFKRVVPHQCLGAIWSRKDKSRTADAATVLATVNQFNAVSFRVMSTILVDPDLKSTERAKLITTWIDIAQELRVLKNFSSLKAIISGLQSNPVYRLQKTWQMVSKDKVELFNELARIFSEDNNQWAQRELLMKEGTAKFADTVGENDRHLQKIIQRQLNNCGNISHGTIPYLGTFLTDLTMIDTAIPDHLPDGLINFDKRRKEFEVLAQIKLLQGAANAYHIEEDNAFDRWFDSILVLDDRESYRLSCQIELVSNMQTNLLTPVMSIANLSTTIVTSHRKVGMGHQKNDSIASTSSSSSSQFYCDLSADSIQSSPHNSLDRKASPSQMSSSSSNSSMLSVDISCSSSNNTSNQSTTIGTFTSSNGNNSCSSPARSNLFPSDFYIIRVTVETNLVETDGIILYKSIMLSNNERTQQVIRNAMLKLGIEGNPENYTLSQILPDKEMVLPSNANVYYAVNTVHNLNFILREKLTSKDESQSTDVPKYKIKKSLLSSS